MPLGDYLRFGIADYVTNNPAPVAGTSYDKADQTAIGTPPFPATLGLAGIGYGIASIDAAGGTLFPLPVPSGNGYNVSIAQINPIYPYAASGRGDVNGGQVGAVFTLGVGNLPPDPESPSGVALLNQFTSPGTHLFQNLAYHAVGAKAAVVQTPKVQSSSTDYFTITSPGSTDGMGNITADPTVKAALFTAPGDSLGTLPPLTANITVPEPVSAAGSFAGVALLAARRRR